jgi:hypothetical protein
LDKHSNNREEAFDLLNNQEVVKFHSKMGGRNINTTKSGKFMNPTDQARKFDCRILNSKISILFFRERSSKERIKEE